MASRSAAPTAKPGEVVIARLIEPRHFRGLAADQRAAGFAAALRDAADHRRADLRIEPRAGEVIQKEERLGALHDEIVDRHRHEIDADGVVAAGFDRDLDLGADAVGRRHQDRILEPGALEVEQPAKAADFGIRPRPARGADQRLDHVDHAVAGVDIDARLRIGQAALFIRPFLVHIRPRATRRGDYVEIALHAMA